MSTIKYRTFQLRVAIALMATGLLAACGKKGVPEAIGDECAWAESYGSAAPTNYSMRTLGRAITENRAATLKWTDGPGDTHILRATWTDPLNGSDHQMNILFQHEPAEDGDAICPKGRQIAAQAEVDGQSMRGIVSGLLDAIVSEWRDKQSKAGIDPYTLEPVGLRPRRPVLTPRAQASAVGDRCSSALPRDASLPDCAPSEPSTASGQPFELRSPPNHGKLKLTEAAPGAWEFSITAYSESGGAVQTGEASGKFTLVNGEGKFSDGESGCELSFERRGATDWHVEQLAPGCSGIAVTLTGDYTK